jgi:tetratricopeptide (TPR) repeat protein
MRQSSFSTVTALAVLLVLALFSFHCSSPEMTSARLYIQQQQWEDALRAINNELESNSENAEAWFLKGQVHNEIGEFDEMNAAFERSMAVSPEFKGQIESIRLTNWASFINAGIEEYNAGAEDPQNYRIAIELFELATKMEPDSTLPYKNIGFAYLVLGELENAVDPFEEVLKRENDGEIAKYLGQIYFDMGYKNWNDYQSTQDENQMAEAEQYLERSIDALKIAMDEMPEDAEALATLSNAFILLDRSEEAKEIFRVGIAHDPENKIYHYNLGVMILQEENYEEAIKYFQDALSLDPDYYDALYNIGVAYVNWGVKMREETVASRDEDDKRYLEKFQLALDPLQRVAGDRPDDANLWETLGRLYANLDRVKEAEEAFEKADSLRR